MFGPKQPKNGPNIEHFQNPRRSFVPSSKMYHLVKNQSATKDNEHEVDHYKIKRVVHCVEEVKFLCHKFLVRPMCEMTRKKRGKFVLGITNEVTSGLPSTTKRRKRGQYNQGQKIRRFLRPSLCFRYSELIGQNIQ